MGQNKVELDFLTNARQIRGELYQVNAYLHNIELSLDNMNRKAITGHAQHSSSLKNLALRFVGYQLVLNQVMGAQQKLYGFVTESVEKFREFQTRIAEVATIMGTDFQPALNAMKSGIVDLSLTFGQYTSDLTKGLYDIMSAAFSAKDSINLLGTATRASIAGLSDVRTSVDIFTTVLNSYGMSAYEATKVSDTLFQSVVRGKFQFVDLESALGYVVPIAAQAGIEFEELMAALSTTTRHGLHLDMASRGLAMALQNIINPSEGAAKAARKYGIEMSGLALRIKGITGVFSEMNEKTKDYGKVILNELIPNIRSLRVAMVLAGDEGLEGLMDDMDKLSVSAGRTSEALNKIKETSSFASKVISQDWENMQRDVGQAWDKLALNVQRTVVDIVKDWKSFLPIVGPIYSTAKLDRERAEFRWIQQESWRLTGKGIPEGLDKVMSRGLNPKEIMKNYLEVQEIISGLGRQINYRSRVGYNYEELENQLKVYTSISADLEEQFNRAFGEPILGGIRNLEELRLKFEEIEYNMEELREHLEKPIEYGWAKGEKGETIAKGTVYGTLGLQKAQLEAEQALADAQFDIKMGLIDEEYAYKQLNAEMQEAIRIVREHEAATKKDKETTELMNVTLRQLQIQMMELQLVGMIRRRGLTRSEEKMMKKLQIAMAKERLKNLKATGQVTAAEQTLYNEKKAMIDEYVAAKEQEVYMLKYSYDQQIADIDDTIKYEENLLEQRKEDWKNTKDEILDVSEDLIIQLTDIFSDEDLVKAFDQLDINIEELLTNVKNARAEISGITGPTPVAVPSPTVKPGYTTLKTAYSAVGSVFPQLLESDMARRLGFQRGTEYVHETGLAMVHEGETIGAAGKTTIGESVIIENLTIEVKEIAEIGSIEKLGALFAEAK
ncbi:MAG: phage tail tape measure protein, partial [Candidatus Thorarchaeota archaeon]